MRRIRSAGLLAALLALTMLAIQAPSQANGRVVVGTDPTNDFANDPDLGFLAGPLGIDVVQLEIGSVPGGVEFVIKLASLETPPPNEVVRYLWQFLVDGKEYWIQAKMSDVASGTTFVDDPVGAATHLTGAFRLRGDCQIVGVVSTCVHLKWIEGVFDFDNDEVRMIVPLDDPVSPHFVSGAEIEPDAADAYQMTASIQAGVSNQSTSDNVLHEEPYTIP